MHDIYSIGPTFPRIAAPLFRTVLFVIFSTPVPIASVYWKQVFYLCGLDRRSDVVIHVVAEALFGTEAIARTKMLHAVSHTPPPRRDLAYVTTVANMFAGILMFVPVGVADDG